MLFLSSLAVEQLRCILHDKEFPCFWLYKQKNALQAYEKATNIRLPLLLQSTMPCYQITGSYLYSSGLGCLISKAWNLQVITDI